MSVTFHTLGSFAADVLSAKLLPCEKCFFLRSDFVYLTVGFIVGVLLHGVLDFAPHNYPFSIPFDIILSLLLYAIFAACVRRRNLILLIACYVGCLFPDLLDLGPAMLKKRTGLGLPVFKAFLWHWHIYSGSIYDGSRQFESNLWHSLMFATSVSLLVYFWRRFFWFGGVEELKRG